jgi:hypothetical protein
MARTQQQRDADLRWLESEKPAGFTDATVVLCLLIFGHAEMAATLVKTLVKQGSAPLDSEEHLACIMAA